MTAQLDNSLADTAERSDQQAAPGQGTGYPSIAGLRDALLPPRRLARLTAHVVAGPNAKTYTDYAPFTGEPLAELPESSVDDVEVAFASARAAQRAWAQVPAEDRAAVFLRFHDLVLARRDEALDLIGLESGKARAHANEEVLDVAITCRYYARRGPGLLRPQRRAGGLPLLTKTTELRHPKGVVGVISPWNYPLTLAVSDAIPALIAGNAVVLKPDSATALTALWAVDLLMEAGLPEGILKVVLGDGPVIGPAVVDGSDYIMFTGSTRVGREVAARCGQRLIGASMELGGKNAMIVCPDASVDKAAEIAVRASYANTGQLCISMERIYVVEPLYQAFVDAFVERVNAMRVGPGLVWGVDMGSLISQKQLDTVVAHVSDAVEAGAQVLAGGRARPDLGPYFFEPTVLADVHDEMLVCRNETFGPVVSVYPVASVQEAMEAANDTDYGLNASVITKNARSGERIAAELRAGTVNVNEGYAAAWGSIDAPMGGMGQSGIGRRHGAEGLLKYTEPQTVAVQRIAGFGTPPGVTDEQWAAGLVRSVQLMKKMGLK